MTLSRPTASLLLEGGGATQLGGSGLTAAQGAVRRLVIELSVDEAHDRAEVAMWRNSALSGAEPGAKLTIGLGNDGDVADVLTVEVAGADATGWGCVITGYAPTRRLSSTYVGRSYVDKTMGDVVSDLLREGEVDEGDVDATLSLPVLHIDPRRSVWGHLHALARRTGSQVTSKADGSVCFTPLPGAGPTGVGAAFGLASTGELREGAELLAFRIGPRAPQPTVKLLTPVGAKAGLLVAEPDTGSGTPVQVDPMLRTQEAADAATAAREAAARRRSRTAWLTVPGRSDLRAGGTVKARGQDYRVLWARHVLDPESGYTCDLLLEGDQ